MNNTQNLYSPDIPLCVDLDHTLIKTDILYESFIKSIKKNGLIRAFIQVFKIIEGKAAFKQELAENIELNVDSLPVNEAVLELVKLESERRDVYLVTATNTELAKEIASKYPYFKEVIGSSRTTNLKGAIKAEKLVERFGEKGFDYIGDNKADLKVWEHSRAGYYVGDDINLLNEARKITNIVEHIRGDVPQTIALLKAVRLHQWFKNILIFVPVVAAHMIYKLELVLSSVAAFLIFGIVASSVYLINDMLDLESDRIHKTKYRRPLAAGDLKLRNALLIAPVLILTASILSILLSWKFFLVMCCYFILTNLYSFVLKSKELIDILMLAGLYTIRIIAGAVATSIELSLWLFTFSVFIFFSLACAKRFVEISAKTGSDSKIPGRGYFSTDKEIIGAFGVTSGITSVLVLSLYINAPDVTVLYSNPSILLLLCPIALYWICKIWLATFRGELDEDPIVYTLKEKLTYVLGAIACIILILSN